MTKAKELDVKAVVLRDATEYHKRDDAPEFEVMTTKNDNGETTFVTVFTADGAVVLTFDEAVAVAKTTLGDRFAVAPL